MSKRYGAFISLPDVEDNHTWHIAGVKVVLTDESHGNDEQAAANFKELLVRLHEVLGDE